MEVNWYRQAQSVKAYFSQFTRRAGSETEYIPRNEQYPGDNGACTIDLFKNSTPPSIRVSVMVEDPSPDPAVNIKIDIPWSPTKYEGPFRAETKPTDVKQLDVNGKNVVLYTSDPIPVRGMKDRTLNMGMANVALLGRTPTIEEMPAVELRKRRKKWK